IFTTPAHVEIHFTTEETQFSTSAVHNIEDAATDYFAELITKDESLRFLDDPKNVLSVNVNVEKQRIDGQQIILDAHVVVLHYGDQGIIDLAALLTFLVNKNNTDSNYVYMDRLVDNGATVEALDFFFESESVPIAANLTMTTASSTQNDSGRSGKEKALIVVVTLLSVALCGLAIVLCWIGGGWLELKRQVKVLLDREEELTRMTQQHGIQAKGTHDTESEEDANSPTRDDQTNFTNPSGILGVYGMNMYGQDKLQGLGIKTPAKNGEVDAAEDDGLATPMSTFSDTDRAPIGIMSMRKLVGPENTLAIRGSEDEEEDDEALDNEHNDIENFGTKLAF
ncbi:MAG: hypothetical protein SGILL_010605, partial [Bacillariaceae sp.]